MERNNGVQFSASSSQLIDDDEPFTEQDLEAIESAFESASKIRRVDDEAGLRRRRLPNSVLALQNPRTFTLSSCQANAKMRYPVMKFGGKIVYSKTASEVERAATELLESIRERKRIVGHVAIGFDIEWKATFEKGALPGKVAVMQMCVDPKYCHVMHIFHSGIPKRLQSLLENSLLLKVGVGIGNDAVKIYKDCNISVEAVEELEYLARKKIGGDNQKWSLASLTEILVSKQLLKLKRIQVGNWEAINLSKDQLEYAATDAYASWYLYQVLKSLPDVENFAAGSTEEVKQASIPP